MNRTHRLTTVIVITIMVSFFGCKQRDTSYKHKAPPPLITSSSMVPTVEEQKKLEAPPQVQMPPVGENISPTPTVIPIIAESKPQSSKKTTPSTCDSNNPNELDFEVENKTGKTIYVTCFAYQRKRDFGHWRWDKSPVYALEPEKIVTIDVDTIPNEQDRNNVYGYLGVFNDKQSADDATYELTEEKNLLELDQLIKLKGKRVTIEIEKYGFKGEFFEYDFVSKDKKKDDAIAELDFAVENKTGLPIFVTCFVYEKKAKGSWIAALEEKDDMSVWRFDKTPIIKLMPDQIGLIDVDTIKTMRDQSYIRGYLAVFEMDEEDLAIQSTFESLETYRKLHMGELARLKNKKIVIEVEKYGMMQEFVDFVIKPVRKIDFTKIPR